MSNSNSDKQFTYGRTIRNDGSITFKCSADLNEWPWLTLHPHHPIALQNLQYWASVECGIENGTFDGTKWTALTWTRWTCGNPDVGGFAHGVSDNVTENGKLMSRVILFDAEDREICSMLSKGVEFRTRDFEAWRAKSKESGTNALKLSDFEFADRDAVGANSTGPALISPLKDSAKPQARGLMTMENAFPPAHPYMSGSGDHVNATHLAEAGHQFLHLLQGGNRTRVTGGEMRFSSYVELGCSFEILLLEKNAESMIMNVKQSGRDCTQITLRFEKH